MKNLTLSITVIFLLFLAAGCGEYEDTDTDEESLAAYTDGNEQGLKDVETVKKGLWEENIVGSPELFNDDEVASKDAGNEFGEAIKFVDMEKKDAWEENIIGSPELFNDDEVASKEEVGTPGNGIYPDTFFITSKKKMLEEQFEIIDEEGHGDDSEYSDDLEDPYDQDNYVKQ